MVAVASLEWQDVINGNFPENPARTAWREAVANVAARAKAALPECNGRVEKAVAIVLAGDVELLPDGKAKVASQSNGATKSHVVNGECSCKDFPEAPQGSVNTDLPMGYTNGRRCSLARRSRPLIPQSRRSHSLQLPRKPFLRLQQVATCMSRSPAARCK
jgi:hypothetical protein